MTLAAIASAGQAFCRQGLKDAAGDHSLALHLPFLKLRLRASSTAMRDLCRQTVVETHGEGTEIRLWLTDRDSCPALVLPAIDLAAAGLGALIRTCEAAGLDGCHDSLYGGWQFFDQARGSGFQLLPAADAMAPWDQAFPLRNFLHWAYAAQGRRLLHAGSLGVGTTGVLLAGAGGTGKSGTTLSGLLGGLASAGDDYLAAECTDAGLRVHAVIRLMKQDPKGMARLGLADEPAFAGPLNWQGKHEFDYAHLGPHARAASLDIGAILLPKIYGGPQSRLRAASPREVLFALLPNNLRQLPGRHQQGLSFLTQVVRRVPGYHLDLGSDPAEIAMTIRSFIESR